MRTENNQTIQRNDAARRSDRIDDPVGPRQPAAAEDIERFRQLLAQRHLAPQDEEAQALQARAAADEASRKDTDAPTWLRDSLPQLDGQMIQQAHRAVAEVPAQAAASHLTPAAFSELIERHVRQLYASDSAARGDGKVMLRLSDATLPGTDLMLERTTDGWRLRADVTSRASYEAIQDFAPALVERFSSRNLGTLEIDPVLRDPA